MTVKELCKIYKTRQSELARMFGIPYRTVQDWYHGRRDPPPYIITLLQKYLNQRDNLEKGDQKDDI